MILKCRKNQCKYTHGNHTWINCEVCEYKANTKILSEGTYGKETWRECQVCEYKVDHKTIQVIICRKCMTNCKVYEFKLL